MRTIPNAVYTTEEITLSNEEKDIAVTLRPLPIARLREFMKEWNKMASLYEPSEGEEEPTAPDEDAIFDVYIRCCAVALKKQLAAEVDGKIYNEVRDFRPEYIELLEDYLDMPSIYKILEVCGGVEINAPKLMEMLEED